MGSGFGDGGGREKRKWRLKLKPPFLFQSERVRERKGVFGLVCDRVVGF